MSWHLDGISSQKSEGRRELRFEQRQYGEFGQVGWPKEVSGGCRLTWKSTEQKATGEWCEGARHRAGFYAAV